MALLQILFSVMECLGPVTSLIDGLVGEGLAACMVPIVSIMNLLHHLLRFIRSETS